MSETRQAFELLDDYQSGVLPEPEAALFEEELFAAAAAGVADEATFVDRLSLMQQYLEPRGGLDMGSTRARVEQLIAAGLKVQVVAPEVAPVVRLPAIDADAEIVVTHIPLDVRGYDSVDVICERPDGSELKTFRDVNWDPEDGTLYAVCEAPLARISTFNRHIVTRVIATRAGEKHTLAVFETLAAP